MNNLIVAVRTALESQLFAAGARLFLFVVIFEKLLEKDIEIR